MEKLDIALVPPAQLVDEKLSILKLFELPFMFNNLREVRDIQNSDLGTMLLSGLSDSQTVALAYWNVGMTQLFSTQPIERVSDLRGLVLGSTGSNRVDATLTRFGIEPKRAGAAAFPQALQTGELMAVEATPSAVASGMISLPPTNILTEPLRPDVRVVLANASAWEKLNYRDRTRLSRLLQDAGEQTDKLAEENHVRDVQILNAEHFAFVNLSENEKNTLRATAEEIWSGEDDLTSLGIVAPVLIRLQGLRGDKIRPSPIQMPAQPSKCCEVIFVTNRDIVTRFGSWCQFTAVHGPVVVGRVVIGANDQLHHRCENFQARQESTPEILGGLEKLDDIIGGQSEILIYVHGYNNSFEDTIFDALKFAKMVNYNGTVVVFFPDG
jgi:TRAP-type C4-dicarboxylate transport system substrate-binding protein